MGLLLSASSGTGILALNGWGHAPVPLPCKPSAALGGCGRIDGPGRAIDHHPIVGGGLLRAQELVAYVSEDRRGIALERVAPATGAGQHMAEHVALLDRHGELAGQDAIFLRRIEIVLGGSTGTAAVEAEGPMIAPVGADLQHPFRLVEAVVAPKG